MHPVRPGHRLNRVMNVKATWTSLPRAARVYLSAVGGVSVAAFAVVVTVAATGTPILAASPSPSPSASPGTGTNYCSRFTGHVASNLGKSQSQVQKAISDAIGQTIDDAVKNGDMTQKQADAIKSKLSGNANANGACTGLRGVPGAGRLAGPGGPGGMPGIARLGMDEIAKALGISTSELQQDLRSGKTVKDLAAAKGMDEAAFRSKLSSVVKADLDQQVKNGKLTQKQEDAVLQRIQNGPLPMWDATAPRAGGQGHGPKRGGSPAPSPSPSPSGTKTG